jgi:hypothetical protein
MKWRALLALVGILLNSAAQANFTVTQGTGTTIVAVDGSNLGTSTCAGANTECPATVLINTAGAAIGVAGLPLQVSLANTGSNGTAVTVSATNLSTNLAQVGGSSVSLGSAASASSIPVVIASDQAAVSVKQGTAANLNATVVGTGTFAVQATVTQATASNLNAAVVGVGAAGTPSGGVLSIQGVASGTNVPVSLAANQSVNVAQVNGVTTLTGTGAQGTGAQRITVATDTATIAGSAPGTAGTASANVLTIQGPNGGGLPLTGCNKVINIAQTATTDVHTFTGFGYICSIMLVSATAQNIGLDEGTGTTCESSGTALIGVSSTSSATPQVALAANGGFSIGDGVPFMKLQASADHLCVLQSSTGEVAGTITYSDLTN